MNLIIDYALCRGCGVCAEAFPEFFIMRDDKAWVINYEQFPIKESQNIPAICPYRAISAE